MPFHKPSYACVSLDTKCRACFIMVGASCAVFAGLAICLSVKQREGKKQSKQARQFMTPKAAQKS